MLVLVRHQWAVTCWIGVQSFCVRWRGDVAKMRTAPENAIFTQNFAMSATPAHTHSLTHTLSHTHTLTRTLTHSHTHTHTFTHSHTHTHSHSHKHTHLLAHSHTLTHTLSLSLSLTHTHTLTRTLSRSHTHTQTHTLYRINDFIYFWRQITTWCHTIKPTPGRESSCVTEQKNWGKKAILFPLNISVCHRMILN